LVLGAKADQVISDGEVLETARANAETGGDEYSHAIPLPEATETAIELAEVLKEGETASLQYHDEFSVTFPDWESREHFKNTTMREHFDPEGKVGGSWSDGYAKIYKDDRGDTIREEHDRFTYNFHLSYPGSALDKNVKAMSGGRDKKMTN